MRLFEIPRGSKLLLSLSRDGENYTEEEVTFHHVDGMYSYCTVDAWPNGENAVHPTAFMSLVFDGKYYKPSGESKDSTDLPTQEEKSGLNDN